MNKLIEKWAHKQDGDLCVCSERGVSYQRDMSRSISYDAAYFEHYRSFAGSQTEIALNDGRLALVSEYARPSASLLDVGVGSGAFILKARAAGFAAKGCDINQTAIEWLRKNGLHANDVSEFEVVTFWDSLEHMSEPENMLERIAKGALVFVAIPVFDDLLRVRQSRHYKPSEHYYYFTARGFVDWLSLYGFTLLETSTHEVDAGRESIGAFAFRRNG